MKKEKAMALCADAIRSGNVTEFIKELNFPYGYPVLDENTEAVLICEGTREMLEYYLKSHPIWGANDNLFKEKWPDLYEKQQERFAR